MGARLQVRCVKRPSGRKQASKSASFYGCKHPDSYAAWSINRDMPILTILIATLAAVQIANAQDHRIDPTWLHRNVATAREGKSGMTTPACHYKPLFGEGDADRPSLKGIARYGEAVVDPHGSCSAVQMPQEDEIDVVLQGKGAATYGAENGRFESR